ncbi:hypothetical protein FR483_n297L [Paramecium bursaria Chlorella virus FR483]|uniref:Uncharacterized protein n297L n=1 Tax=Paramecium bursaria Chlorella virus FR483 TaxID=399781 RepID=A7J701_PBCVF|nr:hypothetical protein FR483_n297L [Paramecium bursaria Chlorella virus FR483]ABT15582.1 hypothetical protein FR483_n297L [Paramecium bursaria Chlorella virus FR483]
MNRSGLLDQLMPFNTRFFPLTTTYDSPSSCGTPFLKVFILVPISTLFHMSYLSAFSKSSLKNPMPWPSGSSPGIFCFKSLGG